jgi:hypothetical protein
MMKRWIGLGVILLLVMPAVQAQVSVSAEMDRNQIMIGDQVELRLFIQSPQGATLEPVDFSGLIGVEGVEIVDEGKLDTVRQAEQLILQQRFKLTSFDSGYYLIPPLVVTFKYQGRRGQAATNQLRLVVDPFPLQGEVDDIAPIKPIVEEERTLEDYLLFIIIGGVLLLIGLGVYWWISRRKREAPVKVEPVLPPHEIALGKLASLKKAKLWQQGEIKEYHSQLTYAVREYLENRYQLPALEATTYEIIRDFRKVEGLGDWVPRMQELLQTADMVKFAKAEPSIELHTKAMDVAEKFIHETKRIEVEDASEEETDSKGQSLG